MDLPLRALLLPVCLTAALLTADSAVAGARAGALPLSERQVGAGHSYFVPVLIYHHVKTLKPADNAIERGLTVQPSQFDAQLRYLSANHYHVITALQLLAVLRGGVHLPSRPVVLTFDDGYSDVFSGVFQRLRRYGLRATFFLVPGFLDTARYLTWSQVHQMSAGGMDIEAHSLTHPDLTTLSQAAATREISGSRRVLQQQLHTTVPIFAYPYGAFNDAIVAAVARAGFQAAFTTRKGWQVSNSDPLRLPRVYVDIDDSLAIFAGRLRADPVVLAQDPT